MKKTIYTHETVDATTGETSTIKTIRKEVKTKEEFVMLYIKHLALVAKLPHYALQTLLCISPVIEWETGEFSLTAKNMFEITNCSGLKETSIRNALTYLKKRNFITRKGNNWYQVNPNIFFKGTDLDRDKLFKLTYEWEIKALN